MNLLRLLLTMVLVIATNVAPVLAACSYASEGVAISAHSCCCVDVAEDECTVSRGSCCTASEQQEPLVPAVPSSSSLGGAPAVSAAIPQLSAVVAYAVPVATSAQTSRRPLHLSSNKLYLEKRLLLI